MQKKPSNRPSPHDLQIAALRDALERASRAVGNAEAVALQARGECQHERRRYLYAAAELNRVVHELKLAREDNVRLRTAIGEYYQERETLTERIRQLAAIGGLAPQNLLRVVEEKEIQVPTPETEIVHVPYPVVEVVEQGESGIRVRPGVEK
jgi:hypothetical protein